MKRLARPAAVLAISLIIGCNGGTTNDQTVQNTNQPNTSAATPMQPVVVDGVGTEPAQAVAVFLDSLRRGDEAAANGVLTNLAREQVQKTNFQIQPPGTPDGKYQIGRVGFPYAEKNVALVECQWTEPSVAGQTPEVMDIVCEVHQEKEGWRIAGLGFKVAGSEDTLVLDFENAASLQETLESATAVPTQPSQTAQAPGSMAPGSVAPGSVAPGAFPPATGNLELPPLPGSSSQIALPPLNNAPAIR